MDLYMQKVQTILIKSVNVDGQRHLQSFLIPKPHSHSFHAY